MLNLSFPFDDAIHALTRYSKHLAVVPLPAAVYMMQVDVINHYRYALEHYLTLALDEPFLQNSSLGTPYQKWAYFTNEDFGMLSFAVHNLLRYTSRLIHETEYLALRGVKRVGSDGLVDGHWRERWQSMMAKSNSYTGPLAEIRCRSRSIGVTIHDDHRLSIVAVRTGPSGEQVETRSTAGGPTRYFRVTSANGTEHEQSIGREEYERVTETIRAETIDIQDRSHLLELQVRGRVEIAELRSRNRAFAEVCDAFYQSRRVAEPFERLNASYWT
jgi:hypothetical protein